MIFAATKREVKNRGVAPTSFLETLIQWGREADASIFEPNDNPHDIYASVKKVLAIRDEASGSYSWLGPLHRRAAMLEVMRVHAGIESSWHWTEGVDRSNVHSQSHKDGEETGIFQVSFDSLRLDKTGGLAAFCGHASAQEFIDRMKSDHAFALGYYARLVRINVRWAGPIIRGETSGSDGLHQNLSVPAMDEFKFLLKLS